MKKMYFYFRKSLSGFIFNQYFLCGIIFLLYILLFTGKTILQEPVCFTCGLVILEIIVCVIFRNEGKMLFCVYLPKKVVVTMRSIRPGKLRKMGDGNIRLKIQEDFKNLLFSGKVKKSIYITTHIVYAKMIVEGIQGYILGKDATVTFRNVNNAKKCVCKGIEISVERKEKNYNYMEFYKISRSCSQNELEKVIKRHYQYLIIIPPEILKLLKDTIE